MHIIRYFLLGAREWCIVKQHVQISVPSNANTFSRHIPVALLNTSEYHRRSTQHHVQQERSSAYISASLSAPVEPVFVLQSTTVSGLTGLIMVRSGTTTSMPNKLKKTHAHTPINIVFGNVASLTLRKMASKRNPVWPLTNTITQLSKVVLLCAPS